MKKFFILIALAAVAALSMVSCRNNSKSRPQESAQEESRQQKQALADSVLASIDLFAYDFIASHEQSFHFDDFELSEKQKLVKPDYLLDPSEANNLVSKSQKINALAIYIMELVIREQYEMPLDETKETIAKLALDVNYPFEADKFDAGTPPSEYYRAEYEECREKGDLTSFWQFQYAVLVETAYIIANNPDLFFSFISNDEWQGFLNSCDKLDEAISTLAQYDDEMGEVWKFRNKMRVSISSGEARAKYADLESARQSNLTDRDKFIVRRNSLLQ